MRYIEKPYYDRQFLMVVDDDRGTANDAVDVFRAGELPMGVNFGNSRAIKNELYIAHPSENGLYIPYAQHEIIYFQDKMHELSILLQSLGAEEVVISWVKGKKASELNKSSFNFEGNVSAGKFGNASADYATSESKSKNNSSVKKVMLRIKSDPIHYPSVPQGLSWYQTETVWKRMVQQRLQGMTTYTLLVSSKSSDDTQSFNSESLKASLRALLVKVNVNVNETFERVFSSEEETVWQVDVKFKPLSAFKQTSSQEVNTGSAWQSSNMNNSQVFANSENAIEMYRTSCKKLIKSDKISETIAIELNRLREKYNISVSDADAIEQEIKNSFKTSWFKRIFK